MDIAEGTAENVGKKSQAEAIIEAATKLSPVHVNSFIEKVLTGNIQLNYDLAKSAEDMAAQLIAIFKCNPEDQRVIRMFCLQQTLNMVLFAAKHHDYGCKNIAKKGEKGVLTRLGDKVARLENLEGKTEVGAEESKLDTWDDINVYPQIALLVRLGHWPGAKKEDNL